MSTPTYLVPFVIGDGTDPVMLTVTRIAELPRGVDGTCAFCHGDPGAEYSPETSLIARYFDRGRGAWAVTCPCCDGRPT